MDKTVYLHIGAHKTGTTALQYSATQSTDTLRAQGVDYPRVCWGGVAHHGLAMALQGVTQGRHAPVQTADAALADLAEAIKASQCPRVLISSEALFRTPAGGVERLAHALSPYKTRVLLTLRRPDDVYLASYTQRAKDPLNGFVAGLRDHLHQPGRMSNAVKMGDQLRPWHDHFGAEAITAFLYEDGNAPQKILDEAGAAIPLVRSRVARNSSPSARFCNMMVWAKQRGFPAGVTRGLYSLGARTIAHGPKPTLGVADRRTIIEAALPQSDAAFAMIGRDNPYTVERLLG